MVPVDSDRITRVPPYSGYFWKIVAFRWQDFHLLWFSFPSNLAMHQFFYSHIEVLQPQFRRIGLGCSLFARHYWGNHCCFLFLRLLRCFSSPRMPLQYADNGLKSVGLSHSEIPGSMVICTWTGLIAAYHVLHRLREPRHPPVALLCFFSLWTILPALLYSLFWFFITSVKLFLLYVKKFTLICVQHVNDRVLSNQGRGGE